MAESAELIGDLEDLDCLVKEYASDDTIYQSKIQVCMCVLSFSVIQYVIIVS